MKSIFRAGLLLTTVLCTRKPQIAIFNAPEEDFSVRMAQECFKAPLIQKSERYDLGFEYENIQSDVEVFNYSFDSNGSARDFEEQISKFHGDIKSKKVEIDARIFVFGMFACQDNLPETFMSDYIHLSRKMVELPRLTAENFQVIFTNKKNTISDEIMEIFQSMDDTNTMKSRYVETLKETCDGYGLDLTQNNIVYVFSHKDSEVYIQREVELFLNTIKRAVIDASTAKDLIQFDNLANPEHSRDYLALNHTQNNDSDVKQDQGTSLANHPTKIADLPIPMKPARVIESDDLLLNPQKHSPGNRDSPSNGTNTQKQKITTRFIVGSSRSSGNESSEIDSVALSDDCNDYSEESCSSTSSSSINSVSSSVFNLFSTLGTDTASNLLEFINSFDKLKKHNRKIKEAIEKAEDKFEAFLNGILVPETNPSMPEKNECEDERTRFH